MTDTLITKKLSIVVAVSSNNAIGKGNELLWYLSADLKHFKNITTGHTIIMGRKTYESIGKPLPNRRSIVITHNKDYKIEGAEVVHSLNDALDLLGENEEGFIIGGAQIYNQVLPFCNKIYLTTVHHHFDADAFFPEIDRKVWKETEKAEHKADERNEFDYTFSTLEKM
ncbi:dihydrofolate reductase [Pedobacter montanisoli]|uniref:Dihydrofolate reductase n=1 Tax=Pedobacter montanisoli TaxID=2923277 RepID=A0ABS9ZZX6_9SPHI|nr:dihydrofolate reductase [Pedobacter montanisoli]MCJ0743864.1 dihydrofolate reductase [Pedobacter montanisoli]